MYINYSTGTTRRMKDGKVRSSNQNKFYLQDKFSHNPFYCSKESFVRLKTNKLLNQKARMYNIYILSDRCISWF